MSVQSSLVMYPILADGNEQQRQTYLPSFASGATIGCFGLTEPDAGSDTGGMRTYAETVSGGYRLTGSKLWITNAPIADIFIVWAKCDADEGRVRGFILEKGIGLSVSKIENKLSLRASATGGIHMDGVIVPRDRILPGAVGLAGPFGCRHSRPLRYRLGRHGFGRDLLARCARLRLGAQGLGRPLAATQLVQKKLADMQTEIVLGLQAALRVGRLMEEGLATPEMISLIKRNNCGKALDIARQVT